MVGLLDPLVVKGVTLKNRIVMPPMQTGRATTEGAVTDRLINFYTRRSTSLGLLIIEHCYISTQGRLSFKQMSIHEDALVEGLKKLARSIHKLHTPAIVQISHAGAVANKRVIGEQPAGPSATRLSRELMRDEIEELPEEFAQATERIARSAWLLTESVLLTVIQQAQGQLRWLSEEQDAFSHYGC